jgi:methylglutaconyl-CoA hydratase
MPFTYLQTRREGPVEYVTLDRPQVRNAFNEDMIAEMTRWAEGLHAAAGVRVAVLAGAGTVFSAGGDLAWMAKMVGYTRDENLRDAECLARMYERLDTLPVPLIGRVQGAALGGGSGLAAICDVVIAARDAVFGFTEVKLGILPGVISPYVIAKIGRSAARELFLTGARFPAERAHQIGLVHAVVDANDLDAAVRRYVNKFLGCGPTAIAATKSLIARVANEPAADVVAMTAEAIAAIRTSAEGQEGLHAFLEKRRATWRQDIDGEPGTR